MQSIYDQIIVLTDQLKKEVVAAEAKLADVAKREEALAAASPSPQAWAEIKAAAEDIRKREAALVTAKEALKAQQDAT